MAIHLKSLTLSIFFFSLLLTQLAASDLGFTTISSCITPYNKSLNYDLKEIDTAFEINLQYLYSDLASKLASASTASPLLYSMSTVGQRPSETVYSLYLCRGDDTADACRACVQSLTDTLFSVTLIDSCKEGFAYMDNCMIHFANYSFFGKWNDAVSPLVRSGFSTYYDEALYDLQGLLKGAIQDAAFYSTTSFATREGSTSETQETVYALAQCSPDLDRQICSGCLNAALVAISNIKTSEPGTVTSAAALHASCQLRYSNVRFYGVSSVTSNSPAVFSAFLVPTWSFILIHLLLG